MNDRTCTPTALTGRMFKFAMLSAAMLMISGCSYWPAAGNNGILYTNVTRPVSVVDKQALATRRGEACSTGILGLYASGNSSINRAKRRGGIEEVHIVEERFTQILAGLYTKYCTVVSGA